VHRHTPNPMSARAATVVVMGRQQPLVNKRCVCHSGRRRENATERSATVNHLMGRVLRGVLLTYLRAR
jgi:hypothetical protein